MSYAITIYEMSSSNGRRAGRDKIYRILGELIEQGYAERILTRGKSGRLGGYEYVVHEHRIARAEKLSTAEPPFTENPYTAEPDTAQPGTADTTLTSNENKLMLNTASIDKKLQKHWQPSHDAMSILDDKGVDPTFIQSALPEFILYWNDRNPFAGHWHSKFVKHVLRAWARHVGDDAFDAPDHVDDPQF